MPKFEEREDINAPADAVWGVLTNPATWPQWFQDVQSVNGSFQMGSNVQVQTHSGVANATVAQAQPGQLLSIFLDTNGQRSTHTFRLSRHGGLFGGNGTTLDYVMEHDAPGGLLGNFIVGGNPFDLSRVKHSLDNIKRLAEAQARGR
jgi:uncharacterized protein YndB with AHSA1/START domain